jgi:predicted MFS family arabinose efflux permease
LDKYTQTATHDEYRRFWFLIGAGWLGTNLGYAMYDLPLRFLLKDQLKLEAAAVAAFFAIGHFTNYVKPLAGIFTDAIPIFGTRRRHYLLISLTVCGAMWLLLSLVPRSYTPLLVSYTLMYISVVFISTTLGGVMSEGGAKFNASGRLSAQRVGIFRIVGLVGGPVGGWLATKAFGYTCAAVAGFHFLLVPLFFYKLVEAPTATKDQQAIDNVKQQAQTIFRSRTLWSAAGLIFLLFIEPGFGTPLFYFQTETLKFKPEFIGWLRTISAPCAVLGALAFSLLCKRFSLRPLIVMGILTHVFVVLMFLGYKSQGSAILITILYDTAQTLAVLPLYDLAIRASPKGSEALGYAVMMSVWNLSSALSDLIGSKLYSMGSFSFTHLIFLNSATTALVLFAVPFLPRALTDRTDA